MIDLSLSSRAFAALFAVTLVAACGDDGKTTATEATGASTGNATTDDSTGTASTTGTTDDSTTGDNPTTTDDATTTSGGPVTTTTTDSTATTTTTDGTSTSTTTTDTSTTTDTTGTTSTTSTTGDGLSFEADVYPIIMANCSCHVGGAPAGLAMSSAMVAYDNLVDVPSSQPNGLDRVEPGDPDASHLFLKVTGNQTTGSQMPLGGMQLPQPDLDTIEQWIADGAQP